MGEFIKACLESKSCFGFYENWDNSWHCKGCPVNNECKSYSIEKGNRENESNNKR